MCCWLILQMACSSPGTPVIHGAGASFPFPIYFKWFGEYQRLHPQTRINYQSIGSGGGIRQLAVGTVDFAGTDIPAESPNVVHIPTVLGGVAIAYNLPAGIPPLKLRPASLAQIFLGEITAWNDPRLVADNPRLAHLQHSLHLIHRSDGSGTTFALTDYLSKVSPPWRQRAGSGVAVRWPVGLGGKGSEGVAGLIAQMPFSIGYVEFNYAFQNQLSVAQLQNRFGDFVQPSLESVTEAARNCIHSIPSNFKVSITDAPGAGSYPISTFTWLLFPQKMQDPAKAALLRNFLQWMLTEGQAMASSLDYAPIPAELTRKIQIAANTIQ